MDQSQAFSIFGKWRDSLTTLRVDTALAVINFSVECTVLRADEPLVSFLLGISGFIEFRFDETWTFDFMAADAARAEIKERIGESPSAERRYEFGEVLVGTRPTGSKMWFLEVVREVLP